MGTRLVIWRMRIHLHGLRLRRDPRRVRHSRFGAC